MASIVINAISLVLSVLLAIAKETRNPEQETVVSGQGTPGDDGKQQGSPKKGLNGAVTKLFSELNMQPKEKDPAGTHCFGAWLTFANVLVTLLGTVVLILNAVITGLAPANTGS